MAACVFGLARGSQGQRVAGSDGQLVMGFHGQLVKWSHGQLVSRSLLVIGVVSEEIQLEYLDKQSMVADS